METTGNDEAGQSGKVNTPSSIKPLSRIKRLGAILVDSLDVVDLLLEHRVVGLFLWILYFSIQDLMKDPDVRTLVESPASIKYWTWATFFWVAFKMLLPTVGGIIAYKSDSWARKGLKKKGTNETTSPSDGGATGAG